MLRGLSTAEKRMLHFQLGYLLPPNRKFPHGVVDFVGRGKAGISPAMVCVQVWCWSECVEDRSGLKNLQIRGSILAFWDTWFQPQPPTKVLHLFIFVNSQLGKSSTHSPAMMKRRWDPHWVGQYSGVPGDSQLTQERRRAARNITGAHCSVIEVPCSTKGWCDPLCTPPRHYPQGPRHTQLFQKTSV